MAPPKDDEKTGGRRRFQDDDEDDGLPALGWGPGDLHLRLRNAIQQHRKRFAVAASVMLATGLFCLFIWSAIVIVAMRRPTVEMAVEALDLGAYEQARAFATSVMNHTPRDELEKHAAALYVYGVATCEAVDRTWLADKKPFFRNAADALAESRELGFMPDRAADGYFYLGKSLYHSRNYPEAIENLEIAREKQFPRKKTIDWYLANAYFQSPQPDYGKGLEALERFQTAPPFFEREKQAATLLKTFLNLRLNRLDDAKAGFQEIPALTDSVMILQRELAAGRIRMLEAKLFRSYADELEKTPQLSVPKDVLDRLEQQLRETPLPDSSASLQTPEPAEGQVSQSSKDFVTAAWRKLATQHFREAIKHFETVKRNDAELFELYRQAAFLEAMCLEQLGEIERAQEGYYSLIRTFPGTAEAVASQFRWSYVELFIKHNRSTGLAALSRFFESLDREENHANSWMPISEIADAGLGEIENLIDARQYDQAEELLEYFRRIISEERQVRLSSRIYSQWGEQLENLAGSKKNDEKQDLIRQAREKFRLAGKWFEELAQWTFSEPDYLSHVWDAASYYERGRDFLKALAMYRLYLEHDIILRQAQARYHIGSILFELNDIDAAVRELEYCLASFPNDPVTEPTRLILACAYQEKQQWDLAARLLKENLDGQYAPDSGVFRDTLYELGGVYDHMRDIPKTMSVFEEVLTLYPDDPKTAEAHYMIAKASLHEEENLQSLMEEAGRQSQVEFNRKALDETQRRALGHLKQARTLLLQQEEQHGLDKAEERMLRNTFFMIGRLLTAMGPDHYEESLQENQTAAARYLGHPDVLQAYLQLAGVYQLQGQPDQANRIMAQAKNLLRQFIAANAFRQETVYSEKQWQDFLGMP